MNSLYFLWRESWVSRIAAMYECKLQTFMFVRKTSRSTEIRENRTFIQSFTRSFICSQKLWIHLRKNTPAVLSHNVTLGRQILWRGSISALRLPRRLEMTAVFSCCECTRSRAVSQFAGLALSVDCWWSGFAASRSKGRVKNSSHPPQ